MAVSVDWINDEKTIIRIHYTKPWIWAEFETAVKEANALMDTVDHPLDMVIQMDGGLPPAIRASQFRSIFSDFHRNIHQTALIGASSMIRITITAFMNVMGQNKEFFFATSLEDAIKGFDQGDQAQQGASRES